MGRGEQPGAVPPPTATYLPWPLLPPVPAGSAGLLREQRCSAQLPKPWITGGSREMDKAGVGWAVPRHGGRNCSQHDLPGRQEARHRLG